MLTYRHVFRGKIEHMNTPAITPENVKGIECRFVIHVPTNQDRTKDLHFAKEVIHFNDGSPPVRRLKPWVNYQRPFWIANKSSQKRYQQKKEWESLENLREFSSTQSDLLHRVSRLLGTPHLANNRRKLYGSPFVYGADISAAAIIKYNEYMKKYPDIITPFTTAYLDTETDMIHGHGGIILSTVYFNKVIYTAILKDFVKGYINVEERLMETFNREMPEIVKTNGIKWEFEFFDTELEVIEASLKRAHHVMPDFLSIWNMNFDIPKMIRGIKNADCDPKDYFSDPNIPKKYRYFNFIQDDPKKITASGKVMSKKPSDQWHSVLTPASFYIIDQMCTYRSIRKAKTEENSYSLDYILNKNFPDLSKLKFKAAEGLEREKFHIFMQEKHPLEYCVYNAFDAYCMELLNEKTADLSHAAPSMIEHSEFRHFNSQPRRYVDGHHFFCLENGYVIGTTGDTIQTDFDNLTVTTEGNIITLETHLTANNGLYIFKDAPHIQTNLRAHSGDLDVASSYPKGQWAFNMSRQTTRKEIVKIEGVDFETQRHMGINLSGGPTNAVEFCTQMFKMPTMQEALKAYQASKQTQLIQ